VPENLIQIVPRETICSMVQISFDKMGEQRFDRVQHHRVILRQVDLNVGLKMSAMDSDANFRLFHVEQFDRQFDVGSSAPQTRL